MKPILDQLRGRAAPVGGCLGPERLVADRPNQWFVFGGHDDDAALGDRMPPPVLVLVIADQRAPRNQDVTIDDGPTDAGVATDADAGHQDRLVQLAEAVHADIRTKDTAGDPASRDDAAAGNDGIERLSAPAAFFGKHEL